jgi:hypothetical protein
MIATIYFFFIEKLNFMTIGLGGIGGMSFTALLPVTPTLLKLESIITGLEDTSSKTVGVFSV